MKQMALDIVVAPTPTFEGFVPGRNAAALGHLRGWAERAPAFRLPLYLWGPAGAGKTHLLHATRQALKEQGAVVVRLDADSPPGQDLQQPWDVLVLDDVHRFDAPRQHLAFNGFIDVAAPSDGRTRAVLAAGALPPADLPLREDLRSRLGWGDVFELQPLDDGERRAALRQAAAARGVELSADVLDYMLARFARDLGSQMGLLDHLDRYALQARRAITVPLLRTMLEDPSWRASLRGTEKSPN